MATGKRTEKVNFPIDAMGAATAQKQTVPPSSSCARSVSNTGTTSSSTCRRCTGNSARRTTLLSLLPTLILATLSYSTMLTYMHHSDAGLTDDHGYVTLKVSLTEKKMVEAYRNVQKATSLQNNGDLKLRQSRRLEDAALHENREDGEKRKEIIERQQSKEEIQRTLARRLLEKGASLRAEKRKEMAKYQGMASGATKNNNQNKKLLRHNSNSGISNVDPAWIKTKLELIQRTREQNDKAGSNYS